MSAADPSNSFRVGLVQMCTGRDVARNLSDATALIREAAKGGASYVQTPEATNLMEIDRQRLFAVAEPESANAGLAALAALAKELAIWLHVGSMGIKASPERLANRAFLISPKGEVTTVRQDPYVRRRSAERRGLS